jgi:pimeloyl-ACP methyl ester carboxylesterase
VVGLEGSPRAGAMRYRVPSRDGTPIAVWRTGRGPPLLLVHGMVADHGTTWQRVRPLLEERFTVHAMDRRGRGESGDGPAYALEREAEDVAAVLEAIGAPTCLVGHSFGALCAAEGALRSGAVERMVLYEGLVLDGSEGVPAGLVHRLQAMLEAGDGEAMLLAFLRDVAGVTEGELELLRADEGAWARRLANAPTIPREMAAEAGYRFEPERFAGFLTPTLLLVGEESPAEEEGTARAVADALPEARVAVLAGQGHLAMYTAPEAFVAAVVDFAGEGA